MIMGQEPWNSNLALVWTKMVGPSRPTISELSIYLKYIRSLQSQRKSKLKMLVLGSTPEFRDLGFEENLNVSVVDCNQDYHNTINREIRHKCLIGTETLYSCKWQDIEFENCFDIIIGDLVIGNIPPFDLEGFIQKIQNALTIGGLFLGKSFYNDRNYQVVVPEDMVRNYYENYPYHPYSSFAYNLTIYALKDNTLVFKNMYDILQKLNQQGILSNETFEKFQNIGWNNEMKFLFYVPFKDEFEILVQRYLTIDCIEYANEVYSKYFPLYIIKK
jgi:hypothetical protein